MQYAINDTPPHQQHCNYLVLGVLAERRYPSTTGRRLEAPGRNALTRALARSGWTGRVGSIRQFPALPGFQAKAVLAVGCGEGEPIPPSVFRRVTHAALSCAQRAGGVKICNHLTELEVLDCDAAWKFGQSVRIAEDIGYRFDAYRSQPPPAPLFKQLALSGSRQDARAGKTALRQAQAVAEGMHRARDLANQPPNVCSPVWLAERALALGKEFPDLQVKVLEPPAMKRLGMGALLAVAQGSHRPPRLIVIEYAGARKPGPIVLIGKGITFDTGGISLKPAAKMDEMKFDMCGAAAVIGTLAAAARLQLPLRLVGVVPTAENMPGGGATRPGDIVTSMSGKTVEILNTDAEGRLVLCDALTYSRRYRAETTIDIATLTGACLVALGRHASGLLGNHQPLLRALRDAGEQSGDRVWRLPLWDDYQEQLHSTFADVGNVGGRDAGVITAACFLSRFAEGLRWAHLDIAGTAWTSDRQRAATGRPVPLLMQYLLNRCAAAAQE